MKDKDGNYVAGGVTTSIGPVVYYNDAKPGESPCALERLKRLSPTHALNDLHDTRGLTRNEIWLMFGLPPDQRFSDLPSHTICKDDEL